MQFYQCRVCGSRVWLDERSPSHCRTRAQLVDFQGDYSGTSPAYDNRAIPIEIDRNDTIKTIHSRYKADARAAHKQLAYGQHLSCSGDRYAMFYALSLLEDAAVAFFCSADEASVTRMNAFTDFYASALVGLENLGHKIVPILTQGDAGADSTEEFSELQRTVERAESHYDELDKTYEKRKRDLEQRLQTHRRNPMPEDNEEKKKYERKEESIQSDMEHHESRFRRAEENRDTANDEARRYYTAAAVVQQNAAATLARKAFYTPFVWTNEADRTWRGGNQLYSDASEPNNISKGTPLSAVAKLIQPHPDLRIITIGKTHLHLSKLLETVGGKEFAAATKYVGTPFLEQNPLWEPAIKIEANRWASAILDDFRRRHPSSTATVKLLLVWIRGLNSTERRDVESLKQQERWDRDDSIFKFAPRNHWTIHDAKKNPHHVMNVQVFQQLEDICKDMSGKHTHVIPVAIGDPLYEDMYDPQSQVVIDGQNPMHLVEYWNRAQRGVLSGEAAMLKQRTFLLSLWKRFEIVQIGVRSGMLEFMAYNGLPTIYMEREVDCDDPDSGAPRIKQLAYELDEMYSSSVQLPKLPWFRMKHKINVGLNQYSRATLYNPKVLQGKKITGTNETEMLGYLNTSETKTLRIGLQNLFQSQWARSLRATAPRKIQFGMKDIEKGEYGLLADDYVTPQ